MTTTFLIELGTNFAVNGFTILLAAILVVSTIATRARPSFAALAAILLYIVSFLAANAWRLVFLYGGDRDLAVQIHQLAAFDVLAVVSWVGWYFVRRPDRLREGDVVAQLYWTVYAFAETAQVFEYLGCKILYDPWMATELAKAWGNEAATSACERAFGPLAPWILPAITTVFLAWPALRAFQVWSKMKRSGNS